MRSSRADETSRLRIRRGSFVTCDKRSAGFPFGGCAAEPAALGVAMPSRSSHRRGLRTRVRERHHARAANRVLRARLRSPPNGESRAPFASRAASAQHEAQPNHQPKAKPCAEHLPPAAGRLEECGQHQNQPHSTQAFAPAKNDGKAGQHGFALASSVQQHGEWRLSHLRQPILTPPAPPPRPAAQGGRSR